MACGLFLTQSDLADIRSRIETHPWARDLFKRVRENTDPETRHGNGLFCRQRGPRKRPVQSQAHGSRVHVSAAFLA